MQELRNELHDALMDLALELEVAGLTLAAKRLRAHAVTIKSGGTPPPKGND